MADQSTGTSTSGSSSGTTTSTTANQNEETQRRSPEPKVMSNTLGVLLKSEYDKNQCREVVKLDPNQTYQIGTVLGRIKATGICVPLKPIGSDGAEIAIGVIIEDPDLTNYAQSAEPIQGLMLARGPAIVSADALIFAAAFDDVKTAKAISELSALGIVARTAA